MTLSRAKKISISVPGIIILLYLVLLIPGPRPPEPGAGFREPFAWNQDDYFDALEYSFNEARKADPLILKSGIDSEFSAIDRLLDSINGRALAPEDAVFDRLEKAVFESAPLVAASPNRIIEFIGLNNSIRNSVKLQSRRWDMNSKEARRRIYRLLYGGRAAVEEVMLQSPKDFYPALIYSFDELSLTPASEILGVSIHSGDILVSRGGAPTSALIARGNDYPGNFSHVALAYVDEDSGRPYIIESHIEVGVTVSSIEQYLKDKKLRVMILRLRSDFPQLMADPMLPHKAAKLAYERAKSEHIPYDFEMDYEDHSKLFCSEVAYAPYESLGVRLWTGISNISSPGLRSWLAAFGIRHFQTHEPSDLEYDPQLVIVAEWRDPETLYKDHLDNAVIDVMLENAEAGERLEYDWYMLPAARIIKACCFLLNQFDMAGPVPEGMSPEAALRNDSFSKKHGKIKERTLSLAEQFDRERGYKPPYWELVRMARIAEYKLK